MAIATLALVGNEAVGKSAALRVLTGSEFPSEHTATFEDAYTWTPGRNFETKNISISILDTAGAPAFDRLRPFSYPGIGIFVVCFAVDDRRSFRDVEDKWVPELKYYVPECAFAVAALKVDLREDEHTEMRLKLDTETVVSADEGLEMMRRIGAKAYAECSAKANIGVLELFEELMRRTI
ncbi:P-loop containing nucleoside triphosphate hydrolase protein, partial [Powellomyces hirtus]